MLDITSNQQSKFKANNWVEINDDSRETYNTIGELKSKLQC